MMDLLLYVLMFVFPLSWKPMHSIVIIGLFVHVREDLLILIVIDYMLVHIIIDINGFFNVW